MKKTAKGGKSPSIDSVKEFWEQTPCGEHFVEGLEEGSAQYFENITRERYRWEYHLPSFLDQVAQVGGTVLEIGCGMGIDASELAKRGCQVTGLDLTSRGIELAKKNFARLGYRGRFLVGNAENLEFADSSFDAVYSCGVLHHTPNTEKAIAEVLRVLKPGGSAFIMLYSRYSLNRLVHEILSAPYEASKGNGDAPVTRVYSKQELKILFRDFVNCRFRKRYLFGAGWRPVSDFIPNWVNDFIGRALGWHWLIVAQKRAPLA